MSDFEDNLIANAFDEFSVSAAPSVKMAGTGAVRATVRHRKIVRATALSVLGALLIGAPVATYAVTSHGSNSPPSISAASTPPLGSPSPVISYSSVPSGAPSNPPPSPGTVPGTPGVGNELTLAQLTSTKVTIPNWPAAINSCAHGKILLGRNPAPASDLYASPQHQSVINNVVYTDFNGDGTLDTAALISCTYGEVGQAQVVVFSRDSAGEIVTDGTIAEGFITGMSAADGHAVQVSISSMLACCSTPHEEEVHQVRTYNWSADRYRQVDGPTSFLPHSAKITFTVSASAVWGKEKNGTYTAAIDVKITNPSAYSSGQILVRTGDVDSPVLGTGMKIAGPLKPGASVIVHLEATYAASYKDIPPYNPADAGKAFLFIDEIGGTTVGETEQIAKYLLWK